MILYKLGADKDFPRCLFAPDFLEALDNVVAGYGKAWKGDPVRCLPSQKSQHTGLCQGDTLEIGLLSTDSADHAIRGEVDSGFATEIDGRHRQVAASPFQRLDHFHGRRVPDHEESREVVIIGHQRQSI